MSDPLISARLRRIIAAHEVDLRRLAVGDEVVESLLLDFLTKLVAWALAQFRQTWQNLFGEGALRVKLEQLAWVTEGTTQRNRQQKTNKY
ncbi:MAG: hypothetical protein GY803_21510 [Chloroflexi bacterium]|nr:hypothetical protein [Chloroflexota bacterium]